MMLLPSLISSPTIKCGPGCRFILAGVVPNIVNFLREKLEFNLARSPSCL